MERRHPSQSCLVVSWAHTNRIHHGTTYVARDPNPRNTSDSGRERWKRRGRTKIQAIQRARERKTRTRSAVPATPTSTADPRQTWTRIRQKRSHDPTTWTRCTAERNKRRGPTGRKPERKGGAVAGRNGPNLGVAERERDTRVVERMQKIPRTRPLS